MANLRLLQGIGAIEWTLLGGSSTVENSNIDITLSNESDYGPATRYIGFDEAPIYTYEGKLVYQGIKRPREQVTIVKEATGSDGKRYCKTSDGYYIYDRFLVEVQPTQEEVDAYRQVTIVEQEEENNVEVNNEEEEKLLPPNDISFGGEGMGTKIVNPITDTDKYKPENFGDASEATKIGSIIIRSIRTIGIIFSVIALMIYGIRYMFGSLEEKAEYKETFVPWIIGGLLLTTGTVIVEFIYTIASSI